MITDAALSKLEKRPLKDFVDYLADVSNTKETISPSTMAFAFEFSEFTQAEFIEYCFDRIRLKVAGRTGGIPASSRGKRATEHDHRIITATNLAFRGRVGCDDDHERLSEEIATDHAGQFRPRLRVAIEIAVAFIRWSQDVKDDLTLLRERVERDENPANGPRDDV